MLEFFVHFRFLDNRDTAKIKSSGDGGGTSSTNGKDSSTMEGRGEACDLMVLLATRGRKDVESIRAVGLFVSSNGGVMFAFL
jgi:hypothetical protein